MTEAQLIKIVAANVIDRRDAKGWTQTDLAKRLRRHQPWLNRLERGRAVPTLRTIANLARVFKCEPADLLRK
jgi:transcriptional regulator with XRE-family HTH domain